MKAFKFMCPKTGREVLTGMELDATTFADLSRETLLTCPHCQWSALLAPGCAGECVALI